MRSLVVGLLGLALVSCSSDGSSHLQGLWGGVDGELIGSGSQAVLTVACLQATFNSELRISPGGIIDTTMGSITAASWQPAVGRLAKISGTATDSLRLAFTAQDKDGNWERDAERLVFSRDQHATYPDGRLCGGN